MYTTHVFAPVVTGAPTKKSKFPNTAANAGTGVPGEFHLSYQFFNFAFGVRLFLSFGSSSECRN